MKNCWKEDRPLSPDTRDFLNALGWIGATLFGAFTLTIPMWFWLLGLC